jgi:hypothetical protein
VDDRPDQLLEHAARTAWRLGLSLAWSDGLSGAAAKACTRNGLAAWKKAAPLNVNEGAACGFFATAARKRNPAVPAVANGLVLVEADVAVPGDAYPELAEVKRRVAALMRRLELEVPRTVIVRSRRGLHFYLRPPAGCAPLKVQLTEEPDAVTVSGDGYLIAVPALHERPGVIYQYVHDGEIAELPRAMYDRLIELGGESRTDARRAYEAGEPIPTGTRGETIFSLALERVRAGVPRRAIVEELLQVNAAQCKPPLDQRQVEEQIDGAIKWARRNPTETEKARAAARALLNGDRQAEEPPPRQSQAKPKRRAVSRRPLREIAPERVELLAGTPVPIGTPSLFAGVGGLGKSALALSYAKRVTDQGGAVLVISYEDAAGAVLRPRFEALGGDLDRLYVLEVDSLEGEVSFPMDLPELDRHVVETEARLVIVDPVSASIDLKLDAHRDQDVRVVLGQLARLAERERFAVLQIAHLNKAPGADPYFRINGSTAFYNAARLVVTVTQDAADPDWQRIVAAHKYNYGAVPEPERWRVVPVTIDTPAGPIDVMTLEFVEVAADVSREDVLAPTSLDKTDTAVGFLRDALADGDWHDSLGLKALAGARRIAERTLKRAAVELDVEYESRGFPRSTWWRLPQSGQTLGPDVGPTGEGA